MPRMVAAQGLAVAANTSTTNLLAGQLYAFVHALPVLVAGAASAVGLYMPFFVNGVAYVNDQPISQANRFPILPDDVIASVRRAAGRLVLTLRNTTGGALTANVTVDVG